jgi:hypothetical protein
MPQVSIIMSVYNAEDYVGHAIESLLKQTYTDFEFIIVNDASTDTSLQVIRSYDDPRIKLVDFQQNRGQTAALNEGLRAASGAYLARQDADDVSHPDRLKKQVEYLDHHPDCLLVGTAAELIDARGQVSSIDRKPVTDAEVRACFADHNNAFYHGSVMFRHDVLALSGYYREGFRTSQDYDMWLRIAEKGAVANLPDPLYQYRLHEGQMTFTSYYRMKAEWKLAEELAVVRASTGGDTAAYEAGAAELRQKFANFTPSRQEKQRAMAEFWRGKGVSFMNSGRYLPMLYCLFRAFLWEPNNPDFWRGVRNHIPGLS